MYVEGSARPRLSYFTSTLLDREKLDTILKIKEISEILKLHKKAISATKYCSHSNEQSYYEGMEEAFNLVLLMASNDEEFLNEKNRFLLKLENRDNAV